MAKTKKEKPGVLNGIIKGHLYLLIILLPLIFWLDTATIFALPKLLVLRTVSLSAVLFIVLDLFLEKRIHLKIPKKSTWLGLWAVSLILSTVFSLNIYTSLFGQYGRYMGLFTFINLAVIPLYIASYFDKQDLKDLIYVSISTASLVALYGLLQYFNFFGLWELPFSWTDAPQNRVFGTMGHANHLGAYLAAHFLMLAYSISFKDFKKQSWLVSLQVTSLLLISYIIILTASRGAVLALILSAFVVFVIRSCKHWKKIKKSLTKVISSVIVILILLIAGAGFFVENISEIAIVKRTEETIGTTEKGIIPDRLSFLYSSFDMFLDHPITGTGLSTFRDAYSAYRRTDYKIDGPGNVQYITVPESAHNEYANTLATQGILGLFALIGIIAASCSVSIKAYKKASQKEENWHLMLIGGLLVFAFQILFNFGEIVNWFIFFLLVGIIFAEDKKLWELKSKLKLAHLVIIILLFTGLIAVGLRGVVNEWQADYYIRQAQEARMNRDIENADNFFQVAIAARPGEYKLHQTYGDFLLENSVTANKSNEKATALKKAISSYGQALESNPNYPSTYHNQALAFLQLYRLTSNEQYATESLKNYELSVKRSPNNPRYLYEYARKLHSDWGDKTKAVDLLKQALNIAPDYQEPQDYLDFLYKNHPELKS